MKKVLITGIGGFVGSHLTEHLLFKKFKVDGIVHPSHKSTHLKRKNVNFIFARRTLRTLSPRMNAGVRIHTSEYREHLLAHVNLKTIPRAFSPRKFITCDLMDEKAVFEALNGKDYDYIYHLAAFSSPAESITKAQETLQNNIFSQLNLLQSLVRLKSRAKILVVGSSEEYGSVPAKYLPIKESAPLSPTSPYAVSKVAQDLLGYQFFLNYGLHIIRVRPFNHIGPGQSASFVVPAFASQIARLEKKGGGEIKVGNLNSWRDFTDVRDIISAYFLVLEKGQAGEVYNVGSGKAYKIADILKKMILHSKARINVVVDNKRLREQEIEKVYCDFSKLQRITGWKPQVPIEKSLSDTIEYERTKLSQSVKSKS